MLRVDSTQPPNRRHAFDTTPLKGPYRGNPPRWFPYYLPAFAPVYFCGMSEMVAFQNRILSRSHQLQDDSPALPMIHPTAVIHRKAKLDSSVSVGPHAVIDENVELGPHCVVGPHVYLTGVVIAGAHNRFHSGCVIGDAPVDLKFTGEPTRLLIGHHNVFREHVTVNCSNTLAEDTIIGSHNLLTPHCHVGHNTRVGDHVVLGGGAMLAGHVVVEDRAFISGN